MRLFKLVFSTKKSLLKAAKNKDSSASMRNEFLSAITDQSEFLGRKDYPERSIVPTGQATQGIHFIYRPIIPNGICPDWDKSSVDFYCPVWDKT